MRFGGDAHGYGNGDKNHAKKKKDKLRITKLSRRKNRR